MQLFTKTFSRSLTEEDRKQNLSFPFQVPSGVTHLKVHFEYAPHKVAGFLNMLTLTLFDPTGWRGAGHRHGDRHEVVLGEDGATPGYLAGPIPTGDWTLVVDTHVVMPGPPCVMQITVSGDAEPLGAPVRPPLGGKTAPHGPGWYRGDLHAHTYHSDASWDIPDLLAFARARGLDFTTLSDHNTVSGLAQMEASSADDLLTLGGMELTTFRGHALALGIHTWVDWRVHPGERSMEQIAVEVTRQGGLFIIAHPASVGDPYCSGCDWRFAAVAPGPARAVEVWNQDWLSDCNNETALKLAYDWLNQGFRLALTAGADNHGEFPDLKYGFDVVYAQELNETEILRAVGAGHLYLSAGPRLELRAQVGERTGMIGDSLEAAEGEQIQMNAAWSGCAAEDRLALVVDGTVRTDAPVGARETQTWELAGGQAHWGLITLRDAQGIMLAMTNPIYFDGRS
jgi:hypothetical protein